MSQGLPKVRIVLDPDGISRHVMVNDQEIRGIATAFVVYKPREIPSVHLVIKSNDIETDEVEAKVKYYGVEGVQSDG